MYGTPEATPTDQTSTASTSAISTPQAASTRNRVDIFVSQPLVAFAAQGLLCSS
jgi:hypothetical protein